MCNETNEMDKKIKEIAKKDPLLAKDLESLINTLKNKESNYETYKQYRHKIFQILMRLREFYDKKEPQEFWYESLNNKDN